MAGYHAGHYDLEVSLAARHNWTATETRAQPRLFMQELMARHEAEQTHMAAEQRKAARRGKRGGVVADDDDGG